MATLVLGAIGTMIGGPLGGSIGALIGRSLDGKLLGSGRREGPRLNEIKLTTSSYGIPIPRHFGRMRVPGQIIWATDLVERKDQQGGGKTSPSTTYSYSASFAVALSSRPLISVGRIWADGKLLRGEAGDLKVGGMMRLHSGHGDQAPDPLIVAVEGAGHAPAYRGLAYVVFEDLQLGEYGNRIPSLSFEVLGDGGTLTVSRLLEGALADSDAPLALDGIAGVSIEGPLSEALSALSPFYPIHADACDERLVLTSDDATGPSTALPDAATSTDPDDFGGKAGFTRQRRGEPEAPVAVLRYYDVDRDFQPGAQRATGRATPGQPRTIDLPASLRAAEALRLIEGVAKRDQWGRQTISWRMTQLDPAVRPGAIVTLPSHSGFWRITAWEWRESGIELMLQREHPLRTPTRSDVDPGRGSTVRDTLAAKTVIAVCEVPSEGSSGFATPQVLAFASSPSIDWTGASLFVDHGDGALVPLGPTGRNRATIGTASTVLPPASPLLFDRHSGVEVTLAGPDFELVDATMRQLAMGANRAIVGEEIIQFGRAEPLSPGCWRLSGLWRGRGGTETAVGRHEVGERFILLDDAGIALDTAKLGSTTHSRILAIGLGDEEPAVSRIALAGIGFRPPHPVHPIWSRLPDGTFRLRWTRRARGAWLWLDGVDTPLGEQAEGYDITFGLPKQPVAQWLTDLPAFELSPDALANLIDFAPAGRFSVRQRGDRALSDQLLIAPPPA